MTCCCEQTASLATKAPGSCQHVNYAKGMVLGVDDFTQEFAYLNGRGEWLARDLGGYGTTCGLAVQLEDDGVNNPRVRVKAGAAVSPRGTLICVPVDQCASLNAWLARPEGIKATTGLVGSPAALTLYLTLCYADCATAKVPIPGEPCRSDDELMKPSRIVDDFRLELRVDPPAQQEEQALRALVRWLADIVPDDHGSPPASTVQDLLQALRDAARPWLDPATASPSTSPPSTEVPDLMLGSPPEALHMHPADRCEFLRAAFRFWVTELRPAWHARCCCAASAGDDCVLLARLDIPLIATSSSPGSFWQAAGGASTVHLDQDARPFIVHERLIQEWMLCGSSCAGGDAISFPAPYGESAGVERILGTPRQVLVDPSGPATVVTLSAPQDIARESKPSFAGLTTTASVEIKVNISNVDIDVDDTMHCVILRPPTPRTGQPKTLKANLPPCGPRPGRVYIVKSPNASVDVVPDGNDNIEEKQGTYTIPQGKSATLVSSGKSGWFVVATT